MTAELGRSGVHHDGSPLYVSTSAPDLGTYVQVRLRTSTRRQPRVVVVRVVHDGEPSISPATPSASIAGVVWWTAEIQVHNPVTNYRWMLAEGDFAYCWLNARGLVDYDVPDADDFVLTSYPAAPSWSNRSAVYQVYPDRFARHSSRDQLSVAGPPPGAGDLPEWAMPRAWAMHPEGRSSNTAREYFGGDLVGIREHLDHIQGLGADIVYLTPVFPAMSTHRYDAISFASIDPLLGGDAALADLNRDAHHRGMRTLGDITLNHCGRDHEWFRKGQDGSLPERTFFWFDPDLPHGYHAWMGVPTLPKLDLSKPALRDALISGPQAPVRRWLGGEVGFDGWRVDVANMAGRLADVDVTHEVARDVRAAMDLTTDDALLIAEHGHDASGDLLGDGWHGTMNYAGFTRQVWCWLRTVGFTGTFMGLPIEVPAYDGYQFVSSIQAFHARIPWRSLLASWNILSSHDTARIRTVVGSAERQIAALALAIGLPGVPVVFAGDEIGATGEWGEDARTPFPWHAPAQWDHQMLAAYTALLNLRRASIALAEGGLRWLHVGPDALAFVREHPDESILLVVSRAAVDPIDIDLLDCGATDVEHQFGFTAAIVDSALVIEVPHAGAGVWRLT